MSAPVPPGRLSLLGPLTTHFHRRSGKTSHYREFLFFWDGDLAVAGYDDMHVSRPFRVNGELVFDKAFKAFRVQRVGSTFTTIQIYTVDDRFLGTYSDTTMPWGGVREAGAGRFETEIDDLYLDHFVFPDGRSFVLDLGELNEGLHRGTLTAEEAALATETASWLEEQHGRSAYPQEALAGLMLDPALLADLPAPPP
jgi:predicted RNA-binding protein associated with RNAse of E/G family